MTSMWCYTNQNRTTEYQALFNQSAKISSKPRPGRKNVNQGFYVGAEAVQLIDASRFGMSPVTRLD